MLLSGRRVKGSVTDQRIALNDIVIHRSGMLQVVDLIISVNGDLYQLLPCSFFLSLSRKLILLSFKILVETCAFFTRICSPSFRTPTGSPSKLISTWPPCPSFLVRTSMVTSSSAPSTMLFAFKEWGLIGVSKSRSALGSTIGLEASCKNIRDYWKVSHWDTGGIIRPPGTRGFSCDTSHGFQGYPGAEADQSC